MTNMVKRFQDLTPEFQPAAGGKGGMLGKLFQDGYPVPDGFVLLSAAFEDEQLHPQAWQQAQGYLNALRQHNGVTHFAVRSSALSEDSAQTSFAGEFETVLNRESDAEILEAIYTVHRSTETERVKAYSAAHGMAENHQMAVVIQQMVPAELSGVLFTADAVTGSYNAMIGNYVHGLGEQLVSGEADAFTFKLLRPKGDYEGPAEFAPYAKQLYDHALKLEKELAIAQDIEWAVAEGKLYLLQARPITTLSIGNLDTYDINESLAEDTLWVNTNVAEAVPDVFTPLTWSVIRGFDEELNFIPGYYVWSGNICGRVYSNIGRRVSAIAALTGWGTPKIMGLLGDIFGPAPEEIQIPLRPFSRSELLKDVLPGVWRVMRTLIKANRTLNQFIKETPTWSREMTARIQQTQTKAALFDLWQNDLQPYTIKAWWGHTTGASGVLNIMALERTLSKLVGKEDANTLLSNLRGQEGLASLGPVIGISKVVKGEWSREKYLRDYGHRGPHEFELSIPHPAEDKNWLEKQIAEYKDLGIDGEALLQKQQQQFEEAKQRLKEQHPWRSVWLLRRLNKTAEGAHKREAARSEFTRVFRVVRAFALKAGQLTGLGDDIFFLYLAELVDLLAGQKVATEFIPARRANYERYKAMPPFPSIIRGRFNPSEWAQDPHRRLDYYDPLLPREAPDSETLTGYPGAAGRVEGTVRILINSEEGDQLRPGEILVASTTNVGWTPLFPKAAAIITDIGAPLSHAAVVARELGIPAVVGCGRATTRLKTGDRVIVDGGRGVVEILS